MDFAARVGVLQDELRHYWSTATISTPAGAWKVNNCRGERRVELFIRKREIEPGSACSGDFQAQDFTRWRGEEFDLGVIKILILRDGHDPGVRALGAGFEGLKLTREVQFAEQKRQRRPHIFRFLQLTFFGAMLVGRIKDYVFAVRNEEFTGRRGVLPAHTAGLSQIQRTRFGVRRRVADSRVSL